MEQEIRVLQIISIILFATLLCLLTYLVIRKIIENRQDNQINERKKQLIGPIFSYLREEGKIEGYKANKNRQAGNRTGSH
ncbi:hypothetical protein AAHB53_08305 [Niallia circulans]